MKLQSLLLLVCVCAFAKGGADDCEPISAESKQRLTMYVHDQFRFPPTITFVLGDNKLIGSSCFRKVHFLSSDVDHRMDLVFFCPLTYAS